MNKIKVNLWQLNWHPANWLLVPWIATEANGWEFSWLFVVFGRYSIDEDDLAWLEAWLDDNS